MTIRTEALAPFRRQQTILLTTYRADGSGVGTPLSMAVDGDRGYVRTYDRAFKVRRLRDDPRAAIAPSTVRGTPAGPALAVRARLLDGDEAAVASRALARKHPLLHGLLVPLAHRLRGYRTLHYELTPAGPAPMSSTALGRPSPEGIDGGREGPRHGRHGSGDRAG